MKLICHNTSLLSAITFAILWTISSCSSSTSKKFEPAQIIEKFMPKEEKQIIMKSRNITLYIPTSEISQANIVIVELLLLSPLKNDTYFVFGVDYNKAVSYNSQALEYDGFKIDQRGYFMHKQQYRLEFPSKISNHTVEKEDKVYLTAFIDGEQEQNLIFSIKVKLVFPYSLLKPCPFGCSNNGICNFIEGNCSCFRGYLDYDCSKLSMNLDDNKYQLNRHNWNLEWSAFLHQEDSKFYFVQDTSLLNGIFMLSIDQVQGSYCGKVDVYYSPETKDLKQLGVADNHYSKTAKSFGSSELESTIQIQLDEFNDSTLVDRLLLFGIRHKGSSPCSLLFKAYWKDQKNESNSKPIFENLMSHEILLLMIGILLILLLILSSLTFWLHQNDSATRNTQTSLLFQKRQEQIVNQQEYDTLIQLIPLYSLEKAAVLFSAQLTIVSTPGQEESCCPICICEFELQDKIRVTYCPHFFHDDCLKQWLLKQKNCPQCRNDLSIEALQKNKQASCFEEDLPIDKQEEIVQNIITKSNESPKKSTQPNQIIKQDFHFISQRNLKNDGSNTPVIPSASTLVGISPNYNDLIKNQLSPQKSKEQSFTAQNINNSLSKKPQASSGSLHKQYTKFIDEDNDKQYQEITFSLERENDFIPIKLISRFSEQLEIPQKISLKKCQSETKSTKEQRKPKEENNHSFCDSENKETAEVYLTDKNSIQNQNKLNHEFQESQLSYIYDTQISMGDLSFKNSSYRKLQLCTSADASPSITNRLKSQFAPQNSILKENNEEEAEEEDEGEGKERIQIKIDQVNCAE